MPLLFGNNDMGMPKRYIGLKIVAQGNWHNISIKVACHSQALRGPVSTGKTASQAPYKFESIRTQGVVFVILETGWHLKRWHRHMTTRSTLGKEVLGRCLSSPSHCQPPHCAAWGRSRVEISPVPLFRSLWGQHHVTGALVCPLKDQWVQTGCKICDIQQLNDIIVLRTYSSLKGGWHNPDTFRTSWGSKYGQNAQVLGDSVHMDIIPMTMTQVVPFAKAYEYVVRGS